MATTPASIANSPRGIAKTLSGFVIQDYTITENPIAEQVPDQYGAIADEQVYDHRYDLSVTAIGASSSATTASLPVSGDVLTFDGKNWQVDSVAEAGNYQTVTRWTISAHRDTNFPAAPAAQTAQNP